MKKRVLIKKDDPSSSPIAWPGSTQWYVNRLNSKKVKNRLNAIKKLVKRKDQRAIEPLIEKFRDAKDFAEVRIEAGRALDIFGGTRAIGALIENLKRSPSYGRDSGTLYAAIQYGYFNVVEALLKKGIVVDLIVDKENIEQALVEAAERGYLGIVKSLVENGSEVTWKPWIYAAAHGKVEVVKYFLGLENHPDINTRFPGPPGGDTALMQAVQNGYFNVVEVLLENGASVNMERRNFPSDWESEGWTALTIALHKAYEVIDEKMDKNSTFEDTLNEAIKKDQHRLKIAKILLKHGADVHKGLNAAGVIGRYRQIISALSEAGAKGA